MAVYKSQTRATNGSLYCIASTTEDQEGFYVVKPDEQLSVDLRAKALNKLRSRLNENVTHGPTYHAGYLKNVVMLFEHDEPENIDNREPVVHIAYKDGKLSARASWGIVRIEGPKSKGLVMQAIEKLIAKTGRDLDGCELIPAKFRGDYYFLIKGW